MSSLRDRLLSAGELYIMASGDPLPSEGYLIPFGNLFDSDDIGVVPVENFLSKVRCAYDELNPTGIVVHLSTQNNKWVADEYVYSTSEQEAKELADQWSEPQYYDIANQEWIDV